MGGPKFSKNPTKINPTRAINLGNQTVCSSLALPSPRWCPPQWPPLVRRFPGDTLHVGALHYQSEWLLHDEFVFIYEPKRDQLGVAPPGEIPERSLCWLSGCGSELRTI